MFKGKRSLCMLSLILDSAEDKIIISWGSSTVSVGMSGEARPRAAVSLGNFEDPVMFIKDLLSSHSMVKDKNVLICEDVLMNIDLKRLLCFILFYYCKVPSVSFCPSSLMALMTTGKQSGLVIDCGHSKTSIVPVCHGYQMNSQAINWDSAGSLILRKMTSLLVEKCFFVSEQGKVAITSEKVAEFSNDLIADLCNKVLAIECTGSFAEFTISESRILVSAEIQDEIANCLFEQDSEGKSLTILVRDCLKKLDIDARSLVMNNVLLIGGVFQFPRIKEILISKLHDLKVNISVFEPRLASWIGASLAGAVQMPFKSKVERSEYLQDQRIYDWTN